MTPREAAYRRAMRAEPGLCAALMECAEDVLVTSAADMAPVVRRIFVASLALSVATNERRRIQRERGRA